MIVGFVVVAFLAVVILMLVFSQKIDAAKAKVEADVKSEVATVKTIEADIKKL